MKEQSTDTAKQAESVRVNIGLSADEYSAVTESASGVNADVTIQRLTDATIFDANDWDGVVCRVTPTFDLEADSSSEATVKFIQKEDWFSAVCSNITDRFVAVIEAILAYFYISFGSVGIAGASCATLSEEEFPKLLAEYGIDLTSIVLGSNDCAEEIYAFVGGQTQSKQHLRLQQTISLGDMYIVLVSHVQGASDAQSVVAVELGIKLQSDVLANKSRAGATVVDENIILSMMADARQSLQAPQYVQYNLQPEQYGSLNAQRQRPHACMNDLRAGVNADSQQQRADPVSSKNTICVQNSVTQSFLRVALAIVNARTTILTNARCRLPQSVATSVIDWVCLRPMAGASVDRTFATQFSSGHTVVDDVAGDGFGAYNISAVSHDCLQAECEMVMAQFSCCDAGYDVELMCEQLLQIAHDTAAYIAGDLVGLGESTASVSSQRDAGSMNARETVTQLPQLNTQETSVAWLAGLCESVPQSVFQDDAASHGEMYQQLSALDSTTVSQVAAENARLMSIGRTAEYMVGDVCRSSGFHSEWVAGTNSAADISCAPARGACGDASVVTLENVSAVDSLAVAVSVSGAIQLDNDCTVILSQLALVQAHDTVVSIFDGQILCQAVVASALDAWVSTHNLATGHVQTAQRSTMYGDAVYNVVNRLVQSEASATRINEVCRQHGDCFGRISKAACSLLNSAVRDMSDACGCDLPAVRTTHNGCCLLLNNMQCSNAEARRLVSDLVAFGSEDASNALVLSQCVHNMGNIHTSDTSELSQSQSNRSCSCAQAEVIDSASGSLLRSVESKYDACIMSRVASAGITPPTIDLYMTDAMRVGTDILLSERIVSPLSLASTLAQQLYEVRLRDSCGDGLRQTNIVFAKSSAEMDGPAARYACLENDVATLVEAEILASRQHDARMVEAVFAESSDLLSQSLFHEVPTRCEIRSKPAAILNESASSATRLRAEFIQRSRAVLSFEQSVTAGWEYPVLRGGSLAITQVYAATLNGGTLCIE